MADALERLANAVLMPGYLAPRPPAWVQREREAGLAGVVLFAQNVGSGAVDAADGFLVAIDEEGGTVTRVDSAGGSPLPGAAQLGAVDDVAATRRVGRMLGERAALVGANMVIAPVADVNANAANPVIGTRAYGADAALVSRHVAATVRGLADAGAVAVPKHFPGHGDTAVDSHHGLPVSDASAADHEELHLAPFRAAIEAGARVIMTAHLVVPEWGPEPATLNAHALRRLRELGFDGVIMSDALDMGAVKDRYGTAGGAVRALAAGCDLLCISNPANPGSSGDDEADFLAVRDAIVAAVRDGTLPRPRLEDAAARVTALRASLPARPVAPEAARPVAAVAAGPVAERSAVGAELKRPPQAAPSVDGDSDPRPVASAAGPRPVAERSAAGAEPKRPPQAAPSADSPRPLPPADAAFAADIADRALLRTGSCAPFAGPRRVLDARAAATWAVAANGGAIASVIAAGGRVERWTDDVTVPEGERAVLLTDRLASPQQRAVVSAFAARVPGGAVVNLGVDPVPGAVPASAAIVTTRAASRLGAEAADRALTAGWA